EVYTPGYSANGHIPQDSSNGHNGNTGGDPPVQENMEDFVLECLKQGEWGDSLLFAHLFAGKVIFDHIEKEWYVWHIHHWKRDDTGRIKHYVSGKLAGCYLRTSA